MAAGMVSLRASTGEQAVWCEAAKQAGFQGFSQWARATLNAAAEVVVAEGRRAADAVAARDQVKAALRGEGLDGGW